MDRTSLKLIRGLVIVPAFNESASIARVVADLRRHAPGFDVVVIDDGSTDLTVTHVPQGATIVSLPFNLGIGGAMQTGYRYAADHGYELAVQVDGDGQHPADQIARLLTRLQDDGADFVIGSRFLEPGSYRQSAARAAGGRVLSLLLQMLTGRRFTDCTSGFRAANRRVIRAFAHWYPDDYPEPEVVLHLKRAGFRVVETPVEMKQRTGGETSIRLFRGVYYVIKVATALVLATTRHPWPPAVVRSV